MAIANEKYFGSEIILELVYRFENMIKNNTQYYFDVSEFENLIDYYVEKENSDKASNVIVIACKQHPNASSLKLKQAQLLLDNGSIKKALALAKEVEKLEPSESEVYILQANCQIELNDITNAEKSVKKALKFNQSELDEAYHDIGVMYLNAEFYEFAVKYIRKAVKTNPGNYAALFDFAYLNFLTENYELSIKFYKKYLAKYPMSSQAWNNIATVYSSLNRTESAIEAYNFSITANRKFELPYLGKAEIYFNKKQYNKAISTYLDLIKIGTDNKSVNFLLADCYQHQNRIDKAVFYYKKSIEDNPFFADSWFSIALILFENKQYEQALKFTNKALKLDDSEVEYWHLSARIAALKGTYQTTCYLFSKAIKTDPEDNNVRISYSEYCFKHGFIEKSISILEDTIEMQGSLADFHYLLAVFYLFENNTPLAKYHFSSALHLDFDFHQILFKYYPQVANFKPFLEMVKAF